MIDIPHIRKVIEAASSSKWKKHQHVLVKSKDPKLAINRWKLNVQKSVLGSFEENDAEFIVMAKEMMPLLLDRIEELENEARRNP